MKGRCVRPALLTDLDDIAAIEHDSFSEPYPSFLIERLIQKHPEGFIVATDSGTLVGYCICSIEGKSAHLLSIAVKLTGRRSGVARSLLLCLVKGLQERDVKELRLEVNVHNGEAIKLYEKFGFERGLVIDGYYADRSSALRMHLNLSKG